MKRFLSVFIIVVMLLSLAACADKKPEPAPTSAPEITAEPTEEPTAEPTEAPTAEPTEEPTAEPTAEPTPEPEPTPTPEPKEVFFEGSAEKVLELIPGEGDDDVRYYIDPYYGDEGSFGPNELDIDGDVLYINEWESLLSCDLNTGEIRRIELPSKIQHVPFAISGGKMISCDYVLDLESMELVPVATPPMGSPWGQYLRTGVFKENGVLRATVVSDRSAWHWEGDYFREKEEYEKTISEFEYDPELMIWHYLGVLYEEWYIRQGDHWEYVQEEYRFKRDGLVTPPGIYLGRDDAGNCYLLTWKCERNEEREEFETYYTIRKYLKGSGEEIFMTIPIRTEDMFASSRPGCRLCGDGSVYVTIPFDDVYTVYRVTL